jgi:tetratricopeptide (TPR) repeat protein
MITKIEIYSTKKTPLVLADYNKIIKLMPEDPGIYCVRGMYYRSHKKWELALTDYNKAIKLDSSCADAYIEKGIVSHKMSNYTDAMCSYQKALRLKQNHPQISVVLINIGLIKYEQGFIDEAIWQWQQVIEINPNIAESKLATAVGLYIKGDESTFEIAETALKLDKKIADLDSLKENLWGERLLADVEKLFSLSRIQNFLSSN